MKWYTALHVAFAHHVWCGHCLMQGGWTTLHQAAATGSTDAVQLLLENGTPLNMADKVCIPQNGRNQHSSPGKRMSTRASIHVPYLIAQFRPHDLNTLLPQLKLTPAHQ